MDPKSEASDVIITKFYHQSSNSRVTLIPAEEIISINTTSFVS
jgi:hypothetical protein